MIELFKNLWLHEPARVIGASTGALVVLVNELGDAAPTWLAIAVGVVVYLGGELTRSQVSPAGS